MFNSLAQHKVGGSLLIATLQIIFLPLFSLSHFTLCERILFICALPIHECIACIPPQVGQLHEAEILFALLHAWICCVNFVLLQKGSCHVYKTNSYCLYLMTPTSRLTCQAYFNFSASSLVFFLPIFPIFNSSIPLKA